MPNAKNIIKANETNGKVIVKLYGQEHDITKKVKDGKATITLYGQEYEVHVAGAKKPAKKIKVTGKKLKALHLRIFFCRLYEKTASSSDAVFCRRPYYIRKDFAKLLSPSVPRALL